MTHVDTADTASLGNTEEKLSPSRGSRKWCFTINNPLESTLDTLTQDFQALSAKYIIGDEKAPTTGTPHYQGFVYFKNAVRFSTLKKIHSTAKWIVAKGSIPQNIEYCSKEKVLVDTLSKTPKIPFTQVLKQMVLEQEYPDVIWKQWQQDILDIINSKPDSRTIHWFWEDNGNIGKSYVFKYICAKHNVIIADGKKDNIFNQVNTTIVKEEKRPEIIILDIPRENEDYINYGVIEQLKNGCIYSGKYEGGVCIFPYPHVIILSNFMPRITSMSLDRWHIVNLSDSS